MQLLAIWGSNIDVHIRLVAVCRDGSDHAGRDGKKAIKKRVIMNTYFAKPKKCICFA